MATHYWRPDQVLAGFHADGPEPAVPELLHAGEQWVPRTYRIGSHSHACWELYAQVDGISHWRGPGGLYVVEPGAFFAMPPQVTHTMEGPPSLRHHFFFAALDMDVIFARLPSVRPAWEKQTFIFSTQGEGVLPPFRQLIREVALELPLRAEGIRAAMDALVVEATRVALGASTPVSLVREHPAVLQVRELLEHHYGEPWRLAELAQRAGVSAAYLMELFTQEIGMGPHQFLISVRLARAQELLRQSDLPITEIALEVGFGSGQHFATAFKKATGQTARQYRAGLDILDEEGKQVAPAKNQGKN